MKICLTNEGKTYRFYLPLSGLLLKVVLKIALPVEKEKAKGQGSDEGEKTHIARKDSENGEEGVAKTDGGGAGFPPRKNEDPFYAAGKGGDSFLRGGDAESIESLPP